MKPFEAVVGTSSIGALGVVTSDHCTPGHVAAGAVTGLVGIYVLRFLWDGRGTLGAALLMLLADALFFRGAALRLLTPTVALSPSVEVNMPGAGRRLLLNGIVVVVGCLLDDAPAAEARIGEGTDALFGRLALLPLLRLARRFGGSSETALFAFR